MKVLALVYPGMTLLDLVGPLQAWSFLPGYEVQYAWHRPALRVRTNEPDESYRVEVRHN
jgi:hypothetical protein